MGVRAAAADPVTAFCVAAALATGWPLSGGSLPDHRPAARMQAWAAQPWPLGKECLLELHDGATERPAPFLWFEAAAAFAALADGTVEPERGMAQVQANLAARRADGRRGSPLCRDQ